jgi:hypothetical protein
MNNQTNLKNSAIETLKVSLNLETNRIGLLSQTVVLLHSYLDPIRNSMQNPKRGRSVLAGNQLISMKTSTLGRGGGPQSKGFFSDLGAGNVFWAVCAAANTASWRRVLLFVATCTTRTQPKPDLDNRTQYAGLTCWMLLCIAKA